MLNINELHNMRTAEAYFKVMKGRDFKQMPDLSNVLVIGKKCTQLDVTLQNTVEYISDPNDGVAAIRYKVGNGFKMFVVAYDKHDVIAFKVNTSGVACKAALKREDYKKGRIKTNIDNSAFHINELIVRLNNIDNGKIDAFGQEYNHHIKVEYKRETLGVDTGSMCLRRQNLIHSVLCTRLYNEVGIIASVKSYYTTQPNVYSLLGYKHLDMTLVNSVPYVIIDDIYYFT